MSRTLPNMDCRAPPPTPVYDSGTEDADKHVDHEMEDVDVQEDLVLKSPEDAVNYWNQSLEKGALSCHHFREWWRRIVPKVLSPKPNMDYQAPLSHIDEEKLSWLLLNPLERFICDGDPVEEMGKLSKLNDPPAQCRKLFKMGEPTYSCRDCGHDPTCVLCVDCFKNSEHKSHRYKMSTSTGGGYCDCGDVEAWSEFTHCSTHILGVISTDGGNPLDKMPQNIQQRAGYVFSSVLKYAYEILVAESALNLPADLTYKVEEEKGPLLLKTDLPLEDEEDIYCTVVFNDEVHTFDEVITTLPRAVDCDRNTAISFATLIDREGRVIIRCAGYEYCHEAKRITERITSRRGSKPLKVMVQHSHVVAHQNFAMRLLTWLQETYLDFSAGFRALFSRIAMQPPDPKSTSSSSTTSSAASRRASRCTMVELLCRNDTALWKAARSLIHHLLISGILMENESKKAFAVEFTKSYGAILKDFMEDDHDHSFSIAVLSVQIFTVPTLAHYLIAKQDVFAVLMRTFMSEAERKRGARGGKLEFQRNLSTQSHFRRTYCILHDLKHLLTTPPDEWDNDLKKGFLYGVSLLFDILMWMQGMDEQVRQVSHHVEYELEWETTFNLHIQLAPVSSLVCQWAARDRIVFIKTMRMAFKKLYEDDHRLAQIEPATLVTKEVCGKAAACIDYQVSSRPISIHLPLTRLLAGLSLHLGRFDLQLNSHELNLHERPTILEMMEPSLRCTVLVAQVQAGLWRRNGYSLVDQVRVYHDPRCRKEMYDQDMLMLQLGAANMDPEDYIINLINKFQLMSWADSSFDCSEDDSIRQVATLVEEFLGCLIIVLGERYSPGVGAGMTPEAALKKEIVQLLCVEPMSHSTLNKALAEDIHRETGLEKVVESVAVFKRGGIVGLSSGNVTRGVYELKKEYYDQYNVFFYHYTREEQSKSEEAQRARLKASGLPQCCPPPPPPPFTPQFAGIIGIMGCDVFMHVLSLVLQRADNLKSRCFSESQVHKVLHLIGLCLHEEERYAKTKSLNEELDSSVASLRRVNFIETARKFDIPALLEQLVGNQRIDSHKELLAWMLDKWRVLTGEQKVKSGDLGDLEKDAAKAMTSVMTATAESELSRKKKAAAEARRAKILAQMKSAQNNFMKENAELFEETPSGLEKRRDESMSSIDTMEVSTVDEKEETMQVTLGPNKSSSVTTDSTFTCILCQEEETLSAEGQALVMAAFVQRSKVLNRRRRDQRQQSTSEESAEKTSGLYSSCLVLLSDMPSAPYTSSCGHIMHSRCWRKFYDDILNHERQRSRMRHPHSFDVDRGEFLCPLCRCLSNAVIPLIPQFHVLQPQQQSGGVEKPVTPVDMPFSEWLQALMIVIKYKRKLSETPTKSEDLTHTCPMIYESALGQVVSSPSLKTQETVSRKRYYTCPLDQVIQELDQLHHDSRSFARLFTDHEGNELQFSDSVFEMMNLFSQAVCRVGLEDGLTYHVSHDERIPLMVWQTCAYTVHSIVWSVLEKGRSVLGPLSSRHHDCLSGLTRLCGVLGSNFGDPKVIRSHALKLLSTLLEVDAADLSILEFDAFGMLVALTFSLPSLFNETHAAALPSANVQDQHILQLLLLVHLVQILLTTDQFTTPPDSEELADDDDSSRHEVAPILDLLQVVRKPVGFSSDSDGSEGLDAWCVWNDVKVASLPFLRCCVLFYHHLFNVPSSKCSSVGVKHFEDDEFEVLMGYLGLPTTPRQLLNSPHLCSLARRWANHPNVRTALSPYGSMTSPVTYPMRLTPLVSLPQDYSELINSVSNFTCPKSVAEDSRVPAMCLVCGEVICSQSYCCQEMLDGREMVGACTAHADRCGAGNGIFLRVRECKMILLSGRKKGCFIQPPYLDRYGETDIGLKRGNPLTLSPERLSKIQRLWLNHAIPEEISHVVESNMVYVGTPWQHL